MPLLWLEESEGRACIYEEDFSDKAGENQVSHEASKVSHMKERPKVGDQVKFQYRGEKIGVVIAVAETGVHFLIKFLTSKIRYTHRLIGINRIIQILPEIDFKLTPVEYKPEQYVS